MRLLSNLLQRFIRQGTLRVRDADSKIHVFGERLPWPDVAIQLHDRKLYTKLFVNPELYAAEPIWTAGWRTVPQSIIFCCCSRSTAQSFMGTAHRS